MPNFFRRAEIGCCRASSRLAHASRSLCRADAGIRCISLSRSCLRRRTNIGRDDLIDISRCDDAAMLEHDAALAPFAQQVRRVRSKYEDAGAADELLHPPLRLSRKRASPAESHSSISRISAGMEVEIAKPNRTSIPAE